MKKLIKAIAILAPAFVAWILWFNFAVIKDIELGKPIEYAPNGIYTVHSVTLDAENITIIHNQNVSPLGSYLGKSEVILVDFTFENTGKEDFSITADDIVVDYDNGVTYEGAMLLTKYGEEGYYNYWENGIRLEKVTSDAMNFVVAVPVPSEIIENQSVPLKVKLFNGIYEVR